ncbi:MAG: glycosyltransferase family 2 protein [Bacteroidota bacterium]
MPLDLTVAIPVKNEAINLPRCLEAIGKDWAKEVVVIDSNSTDNTLTIAKDFGVQPLSFSWNGQYPKKRNWFLLHHQPSTLWVLFLFADEVITPSFKKEVEENLSANLPYHGYWLRYTNYFMGKKLKGGYPLDKLALFRIGKGLYENIPENYWSKMDMEVHEHPIVEGSVGIIKNRIEHNDFRSIHHYMTKHNEYAVWEAHRYIHTVKQSVRNTNWTWKQRMKYKIIATPFSGIFFFLGSFIFYGGFRDGYRGLIFATFKMSYFTQVYCCIRELKNK